MIASPFAPSDPQLLDRAWRIKVFEDYGAFVTSLRGCYNTAEDVGVHSADMASIFSKTRFTTCIPENVGGSGNPSIKTGWGIVSGMEAAVDALGMGKVGSAEGALKRGQPTIERSR